jgi:hypothetical protein
MNDEISSEQIERGYPRAAGAFLAAIGGGLLYWMVWLPIQAAQHHVANIQLTPKGTVVGTCVLLVGLLKLVLGSSATRFLRPEGDESKFPAIIVGVIILAAGFGAHHRLNTYLEMQGYAANHSAVLRVDHAQPSENE